MAVVEASKRFQRASPLFPSTNREFSGVVVYQSNIEPRSFKRQSVMSVRAVEQAITPAIPTARERESILPARAKERTPPGKPTSSCDSTSSFPLIIVVIIYDVTL